jgi:hypothetical protein
MTTDEEDEFMEQMMAKQNMLTMAARKATQVSEGSVMECKVIETDSPRSSG